MSGAVQDQYVEVKIDQERYAVKIDAIHEIIKMQEVTEIPKSKSYVLGVINLRGKIIPIVSLRNRFGMPEVSVTKATRIVVVNHEDEMVGIVVDQVVRVASLSNIQTPPERMGTVSNTFIKGIHESGSDLISILDLDQVLRE